MNCINFEQIKSTCKVLKESGVEVHFKPNKEAHLNLLVKASSYGAIYNGVTASVAIPEIYYHGGGTPTFLIIFAIPSASSYDWSSYPPFTVDQSSATWDEELNNGVTPARVAVGLNPAAQESKDRLTFIAGALLGLGGGALLSAVQEALHASD